MDANVVCRMVKRRMRQAGISSMLSPHSFRVTTITDLLEQGVPIKDVQHLAGHADPSGMTGGPVGLSMSSLRAALKKPSALIFGPDGNLYVNSQGTNAVLRYDGTDGHFIDTFANSDQIDQDSIGLIFGPDGNLYVNSHKTDSVLRFDGTTGAFLGTFAQGPELQQPSGLEFGQSLLWPASHVAF